MPNAIVLRCASGSGPLIAAIDRVLGGETEIVMFECAYHWVDLGFCLSRPGCDYSPIRNRHPDFAHDSFRITGLQPKIGRLFQCQIYRTGRIVKADRRCKHTRAKVRRRRIEVVDG